MRTPVKSWALLALFLLLLVFSLPAWEGSGRDFSAWENLLRFLHRFFPPDFSDWRELAEGFRETAQIGFLATAIAAVV